MRKVARSVNSHFLSPPSDCHILRLVTECSVYLAPTLPPRFSEEHEQTSGRLGLQLASLGLLEPNSCKDTCSFVSPQCSCVALCSEADPHSPEGLTFSHSLVRVSPAPVGSDLGTLRSQEKRPGLQNYFSSWHKGPQVQHMILRHLPSSEMLACPTLLSDRKPILLCTPSSAQVRPPWKPSVRTRVPQPGLPARPSLLPTLLRVSSRFPRATTVDFLSLFSFCFVT